MRSLVDGEHPQHVQQRESQRANNSLHSDIGKLHLRATAQHSTATLQPTATQQLQAQNEQSKLSPLSAKVLIKHHHFALVGCCCFAELSSRDESSASSGVAAFKPLGWSQYASTNPFLVTVPLCFCLACLGITTNVAIHCTTPALHSTSTAGGGGYVVTNVATPHIATNVATTVAGSIITKVATNVATTITAN